MSGRASEWVRAWERVCLTGGWLANSLTKYYHNSQFSQNSELRTQNSQLTEAGAARLPFLLQPKIHLFYSRRIVGDLFATDGLPKYDTFPP